MSKINKDEYWVTPTSYDKYYVYAYFDEVGEPFYVGKGKGYRVNNHTKPSMLKEKSHKSHKISHLLKTQGFVKRDILAYFDTEDRAYDFEEYLISLYGLRCNGTGILTNVFESRHDMYSIKSFNASECRTSRTKVSSSEMLELYSKYKSGKSLEYLSGISGLTQKYLDDVFKGRKRKSLGICDYTPTYQQPKSSLNSDIKNNIIELFDSGKTKECIAEQLGLKVKVVYKFLVYSNKIFPKKRSSEKIKNQIRLLRSEGKSYGFIMNKFGLPKTTVARICKTVEDVGTTGNGTSDSVATADTNANNLNKS